MAFDWMEGSPRTWTAGSFRDQHVREIRERARLLYNLRFSAQATTQRIQRAIAWEFDDFASTPMPAFYDEVGALVEAVYAHANRGK